MEAGKQQSGKTTSVALLASIVMISAAFASQESPNCDDLAFTRDTYKGRFFSNMTISSSTTIKEMEASSVYGCNDECWRSTNCIAISYNMSDIGEGNCKWFNLTRIQKYMMATKDSVVILQLPIECGKNSTEDGGWTTWSAVGQCGSTCGGGTRLMERSCSQPRPHCNGDICEGESTMYESCNQVHCPGAWGPWPGWDPLPVTDCEGKIRTRTCESVNGVCCLGVDTQVKECQGSTANIKEYRLADQTNDWDAAECYCESIGLTITSYLDPFHLGLPVTSVRKQYWITCNADHADDECNCEESTERTMFHTETGISAFANCQDKPDAGISVCGH